MGFVWVSVPGTKGINSIYNKITILRPRIIIKKKKKTLGKWNVCGYESALCSVFNEKGCIASPLIPLINWLDTSWLAGLTAHLIWNPLQRQSTPWAPVLQLSLSLLRTTLCTQCAKSGGLKGYQIPIQIQIYSCCGAFCVFCQYLFR